MAQAFCSPRALVRACTPNEERFRAVLPYLPVILSQLLVCVLFLVARRSLDWQVVLLLVPLFVLLLWRQGLVLREVRSFARSLEDKVAQRTHALEQAQALLLQTERMNTMASLGAGLAHDLNNFLGIAKNYAELVEEGLLEGKLPDVQPVRRIKESVTRAAEYSAQLMAFGRQQELSVQAFDLRDRLETLRPLLSLVVPLPIELLFDLSPEAVPLCLDASRIDQILVNLLSNAKDAMPRGGRIWIRVRPQGDCALLEVQDEGLGIPASIRERIFDPFFTTKPLGKGTGLGLASVKILVDQVGGSLTMASEEGAGTRFQLRFPMVMAAGKPG